VKADIKYTVKHHPRLIKKLATALAMLGGSAIVLLDLAWVCFKWATLAIVIAMPGLFLAVNVIGILTIVIGFVMRTLLKWRPGKIELNDDQLIIEGSYRVSIWLRNLWEVDVRDTSYRRVINLDSNVDAVQIKFKTEQEFEAFSEKLIVSAEQGDNIKIKTSS
jgi:hypothetical protein